jgi:TonB family protein
MRTARLLPVFLCLPAPLAVAAFAQNPTADLPKDPASLLQRASPVNGMRGLSGKPWHIHATYQVLDDKKQPVDSGTLEEWWAEAGKYKFALEARRARQTLHVYTFDGHTTLEGDRADRTYPFNLILPAMQSPLPDDAWAASMTLSWQNTRIGDEDLGCIVAQSPLTDPSRNASEESRYCFQPSSLAVRLSVLGVTQYAYDSITQFDGQYIAQDLRITPAGKLASEVDVHVDALEDLGPVSDAEFSPPVAETGSAGAVPIPMSVMAGKRISGKTPKYPSSAKKKHIQGTVVLLATIGKDGNIRDLEVVSGPPELQEPSVEAVREWRYTPYLLNGQPVEVETQINVNFALGH